MVCMFGSKEKERLIRAGCGCKTYKVTNQDHICELQGANYDEKSKEDIQKLCSLRGLGNVFGPDVLGDCGRAGVVGGFAGARGRG